MIAKLEKSHIPAVAEAQLRAWQEGFRGILSQKTLLDLRVEEFISNWKQIILQKERRNYVALTNEEGAIGFISCGKPKAKEEQAEFEVYGIYVHPEYWGRGFGKALMDKATGKMNKINPSGKTILWTMSLNKISCKFYEKYGFSRTGKRRISSRYEDEFEEVQFVL